MSIPQVVTRYSFVLLAIDRVVGVAFPYHYRKRMKLKVVYSLIASVWITAGVILLLLDTLGSPYLMWPFGICVLLSGNPLIFVLYVMPLVVSAIMIVGTNVYLYRSIIQSKKKLENNLKLSGKDEYKITKLQRLIHNLHMQFETCVCTRRSGLSSFCTAYCNYYNS